MRSCLAYRARRHGLLPDRADRRPPDLARDRGSLEPPRSRPAGSRRRMSVDWARVFFHWQTEPIALLGLAIETYAAGLYAYGVVRLRRTGRRWPTGRLVAFMSGIIALALVL